MDLRATMADRFAKNAWRGVRISRSQKATMPAARPSCSRSLLWKSVMALAILLDCRSDLPLRSSNNCRLA
jgi:hypothetical protein